ncbi:MAG: hypothetical protein ACLR7U_02325 [Ruthenibacterium lactatiformans]
MEAETPHQTAFAPVEEEQRRDSLRFVGEVFDTYIVTQRGNDMCLLDKHAAHERIIYESLAASYGKVSSQMLLVPVTVQLSRKKRMHWCKVKCFYRTAVWKWRTSAAILSWCVPSRRTSCLRMWRTCGGAGQQAGLQPAVYHQRKTEWVLHSIARRAAIKAGDKTHAAQLLRWRRMLDGRVPPFCPHGRPIVLKITKKELEKQFGRQG